MTQKGVNIYAPVGEVGVKPSCDELPVATHVMQMSFNELSSSIAVKCIYKQREKYIFIKFLPLQ